VNIKENEKFCKSVYAKWFIRKITVGKRRVILRVSESDQRVDY